MYPNNTSLNMHIKNVHTKDEKTGLKVAKQCPHCEKSFLCIANYNEHVKSKHQKNTPFKCDECERSYATISVLKTHKKLLHHRVKCEECGKGSYNAFDLKKHRANAHGITPKDAYQCNDCPKFFSIQTFLDKHIRSKHSSNKI